MSDRSVQLVISQLAGRDGELLVVADENWQGADWRAIPKHAVIISNRCDIADEARESGLEVLFNDFEFEQFAAGSVDVIAWRVAKERALGHHVLNSAAQLLRLGGVLLIGGEKHDGVKTYAKNAGNLLGASRQLKKVGNLYAGELIKHRNAEGNLLDDNNYSQLRLIGEQDGICFFSKPGIFGWNRIDQGSALLIEHLPRFLDNFESSPHSLLDLGCGDGYLACLAARHGFSDVVATDNNAAALAATRHNFTALKIKGEVIAADAGNSIKQKFDLILCNPPFHQGFAVSGDLTDKFLRAARRLLQPRGKALFVVNGFVPLAQKAGQSFSQVHPVAENKSYKLIALQH